LQAAKHVSVNRTKKENKGMKETKYF